MAFTKLTTAQVVTASGDSLQDALDQLPVSLSATVAAEADRAEIARDAAQLSAGIFANTAAGLARPGGSVGGYFSVPSVDADEYLILYRHDAGPVATEVNRYPSAGPVQRPSWAGKANWWPDPFFRSLDLASVANFFKKNRWWGGTTGWSLVNNGVFAGKALQRLSTAQSTPLNGPYLHFGEIGAVAGDTVTVCALVTGNGANAQLFAREWDENTNSAAGGQKTFLKTNGISGTGVTSATPVLMRLTFVMAAASTHLQLYSTHTGSGGQTYQIVALWGFKGAASAGPSWPILNYEPQREAVAEERLATAEAGVQDALTTVGAAVTSRGNVTAGAEVIVVNGANFTTGPRGLVFSGWGERFLPAGVSFNAVRLVTISRTSVSLDDRWRYLRIVIRTGSNSHASGSTVVAVGEIQVNPGSDLLNNVTVLLKDPLTGANKTLTDADFIGGEYFIGVYARNLLGAVAACGEPRGTMTNTQGNSYYLTAGDPFTSTWLTYTSNARLAFQHLMLTSPQEAVVYEPTVEFAAALAGVSSESAPELILPPAVYGLEGAEANLYFDNLLLTSAKDYLFDVDSTGAVGQQLDECWRWNPTGVVTSGTVTIKVHAKGSGMQLASASLDQRAAAAGAGLGLNKKVMVVGDSLINAGVITQTLLDLAGPDVMDITLLGTRGTGLNKHEGRGGWRVSDYATVGRIYHRFTVSGVTVAPSINSTKYSNNGAVFTVQEVNLVAGAGTLVCSLDSGVGPLATGTLTKTFGTGDATITFSAAATESGNPFWHGGALNYGTYLANNGISVPDWVLVALGINDVFGQISDAAAQATADAAFDQLDLLMASMKAAGAGVKVGLVVPTPPAFDQSAFGANYTTGQPRWRFKRNIMIWASRLMARYKAREAERLYVVPSHVSLDTVRGYPYQTVAANARTTQTIIRQTNSVHPDVSGYQQIGDAIWAFLKYYA